jgi:uncharacterized protein YnzC (UPF0291/DUF896 family)
MIASTGTDTAALCHRHSNQERHIIAFTHQLAHLDIVADSLSHGNHQRRSKLRRMYLPIKKPFDNWICNVEIVSESCLDIDLAQFENLNLLILTPKSRILRQIDVKNSCFLNIQMASKSTLRPMILGVILL